MYRSLAQVPRQSHGYGMPKLSDNEHEQRLWGWALASLRDRAKLTLEAAGQNLEPPLSGQAFSLWERGKVQGILTPEGQERVARAVNSTREELARKRVEVERFGGPLPAMGGGGLADRGRVFELPMHRRNANASEMTADRLIDLATRFGPSSRATQLTGDSLYPWGASGITLVYDMALWPRRDQGCIVALKDGRTLIKLYVSDDDEKIYLRELKPERTIEIPRDTVEAVYAVTDRMD